MSFYIQSGYKGKEVGSIMMNYDKSDLSYSAVSEYKEGQVPVGTVEFVEQIIGIKKPNYYPDFLSSSFYRKVYESNELPEKVSFVKPADRHKRFNGMILHKADLSEWVEQEWRNGPYSISEIVFFEEEWRYYVANGKIVAAHWYLGKEIEIDPPKLNVAFPSSFCGAVDFGRLKTGEVALVENNLPYACGWYGSFDDGKVYGEWLKEGFNYIKNKKT